MRTPRIYTISALQPGRSAVLDEKASHHLSKVLRHKVGDALVLFNGDGEQYPARISGIDRKRVTVTIERAETVDNESPLTTHLGIAVSKGDRFDWVIQKATELGVTAITPLTTERTEFKLSGERLQKKMTHWQQVSISACEQCGRSRLVDIHPLAPVNEWIRSVEAERKFVLHHRTDARPDPTVKVDSAALLIGPEGGLSPEEIETAQQHGFRPLSLGPRVLRTETAPVAAVAILQYLWGDF